MPPHAGAHIVVRTRGRCVTEVTIGNVTLMGGGPYEPLCDPIGEWLVWDAMRENVAEFDGYVFHGLTQREAIRFSMLMNDMVRPSSREGSSYRSVQEA